jgi:hypothetical protein
MEAAFLVTTLVLRNHPRVCTSSLTHSLTHSLCMWLAEYAVFETRLTSTRPANQQCGVLSTRSLEVLPGHYQLDASTPYDACAERGSYVASYEFSVAGTGTSVVTGIRGFEFGVTHESDHVSRGFAQDELGYGYVTLNYRLPGSSMVQLRWCGSGQGDRAKASEFTTCHTKVVIPATNFSPYACDRNRALSDLPSRPVGESSDSSASSLRVALGAVVMMGVAMLMF